MSTIAKPTASTVAIGYRNRTGVATLPGQNVDSAELVNRCLQENHDQHHIFFNKSSFHNHIVHHLLALYSLGGSPSVIQQGYDENKDYQRPLDLPEAPKNTHIPKDRVRWGDFVAKQEYYADFLRYFTAEIDTYGWEQTVEKHLFEESKESEDMLMRLFGGFLHPFIHLGYGVEHEQPAIIAEALAQAAVHDNWVTPFLQGCAAAKPSVGKSFLEVLDECRSSEQLQHATKMDDGHKAKALMQRAGDEMVRVASQFAVTDESQLESKLKEVIEGAAYICGAALRPKKAIKFDFVLMHTINSTPLLCAYIAASGVSTSAKMRLVSMLGQMSLNLYVSYGCPMLYAEEISSYTPKYAPLSNPWLGVVNRALRLKDDGHTVKFVRACLNGEQIVGYDGTVMKRDMWSKLGSMVIDSAEEVQGDESQWVRSTGFDEAWAKVGERKKYTAQKLVVDGPKI